MNDLPIKHCLPNLLATLQTNPNTVLSAPPGAGKTTLVPLEILKIIPPAAGSIIMLEPRRIAAVSAARYMAELLDEPVGRTVGYTIRFERQVSAGTRIEVVTEGVLTRRIQGNPQLEGVACLIFDEFHERSIHADLGLALCLEIQSALRPDLKLLVMSATLDCAAVSRLLGDAPVVVSEGRQFPVAVRYSFISERHPLARKMAGLIRNALVEEDGDLLAFLPGSAEIRAVEHELTGLTDAVIFPLYGDLPFEQQKKAVLPGKNRRVVLATNIAETSLTIDGVKIVVDSGLSRRLQLDPATGLERLVTVRTSKASADQRKGRAGRTAPGVCYRLYGEHNYQAMSPFSPPEILNADLSPLFLELAAWGVTDPVKLCWLNPPPEAHIQAARRVLNMLGAIDAVNKITAVGRQMAELPLHPRLARFLIAAESSGKLADACRLAAELSHRSVALSAIRQTEKQLSDLMKKRDVVAESADISAYCAAWPDRIAKRRGNGSVGYLLASGRGARLAYDNSLHPELLVALKVNAGTGEEGIIHQSVEVTADQIRHTVPELISKKLVIRWNDKAGRIDAAEEEAIGAVILSSRQASVSDEEAVPILLEQIRYHGIGIFRTSDLIRQLQSRIKLVRDCIPEMEWPDISDISILEHLDDWLSPYLYSIRSLDELKRIDIVKLLHDIIGWKHLELLDRAAPLELKVPSGRKIHIEYYLDKEPVLAVKLQELFGMNSTPVICEGRLPLLIHLLSPAGRPVAVTRDLASFWQNGYFSVRKELRGRYPKHPWPDDPWNAVPTHLTRKALERQR